MHEEAVIVYLYLLLVWVQILRIKKLVMRRRKVCRRWWTKLHLKPYLRYNFGAYQKLFVYFKYNDHEEFFRFTRMTTVQFDYLHDLLKSRLQRASRRQSLQTELILAATLNYLAHGDNVSTTAMLFRIGKSTMYKIISEVCQKIWDVLQPLYLQCPKKEIDWLQISIDFNNIWNFPNCIGAIDGKHCRVKAPYDSGSLFHNYKGFFSFVLMAICDAHYRFIWLDIGDYGSLNDAGIWSNCAMSTAIEHNTISIPPPAPLTNTNVKVPFALVGDEGFPLKSYLMRPYAKRNLLGQEQRIFNYRLSRARRTIESSFGILVKRWEVLQNSIGLKVENAQIVVQAICCLHNFIITTKMGNDQYLPNEGNSDLIDNWRLHNNQNFLQPLGRVGANNSSITAMSQRDELSKYFASEAGSVPWQWNNI